MPVAHGWLFRLTTIRAWAVWHRFQVNPLEETLSVSLLPSTRRLLPGNSRTFLYHDGVASWDERYRNGEGLDGAVCPLLVEAVADVSPGDALDLACGPGRHAIYLAGRGWRVTAVDASAVAIELLLQRTSNLLVDARLADLEQGEFRIEPASYDLICDVHYLQRGLFPSICDGLRPRGLVVASIHVKDDSAVRPMNPEFLLESGELPGFFPGFEVLLYEECIDTGHERKSARLIARKPVVER